jgi:hypothetical protein
MRRSKNIKTQAPMVATINLPINPTPGKHADGSHQPSAT